MAAFMVISLAMAVFFGVAGLLEKAVPEKVWDKLLMLFGVDGENK